MKVNVSSPSLHGWLRPLHKHLSLFSHSTYCLLWWVMNKWALARLVGLWCRVQEQGASPKHKKYDCILSGPPFIQVKLSLMWTMVSRHISFVRDKLLKIGVKTVILRKKKKKSCSWDSSWKGWDFCITCHSMPELKCWIRWLISQKGDLSCQDF